MFSKLYNEIMEHILLLDEKRKEILKAISKEGTEHLDTKATAPSK